MAVRVNNTKEDPVIVIDVVHENIHDKNFWDSQYIFDDVANDGVAYISIRATQCKEMHFTVAVDAEGKCLFKSYVNTTWADDGIEGDIFNRYINGAPDATGLIYYAGTPDVLGTQRFQKLILGGLGPQSTGSSAQGSRVESVLDPGNEITIEITNVSGNVKDFGVIIEWYEVAENDG